MSRKMRFQNKSFSRLSRTMTLLKGRNASRLRQDRMLVEDARLRVNVPKTSFSPEFQWAISTYFRIKFNVDIYFHAFVTKRDCSSRQSSSPSTVFNSKDS